MADGTQNDPWIVETYAELVEKAAADCYIRLGKDINITDEYPDGDMPTLEMADCDIDGGGKTIANWYKITSGYCIANTDNTDTLCNIHDLFIKNIYIESSCTAFCKRAEDTNARSFFTNCKFSGVMKKQFTDDSSSTLRFDTCSFNIDLDSNKPFGSNGGFFNNCFVRFRSDYASGGFFSDITLTANARDSYFELDLPSLAGGNYLDQYGHGFINSVLDVTSDSGFYVGGGSHAVSIIHKDHAPNCHPDGTNVKGVPASDWLNVTALHDTYGFNAG